MPKIVFIFLIFIGAAIVITFITFSVFQNRAPAVSQLQQKIEDRSEVITSKTSIVMSDDSGMTWKRLPGSDELALTVFQFKKGSDAEFYVGTKKQGLWISKDNGTRIEKIKDPTNVLAPNADIYALAQNADGTALTIAVFQNGYGQLIRLTEEKAEQLYRTSLQNFGIFGVIVDPNDPRHINISSGEGYFLQSVDGGTTWEPIAYTTQGIVMVLAHPSNSSIFWAVGNKGAFYYTESGGRLWRAIDAPTVEETKIKKIYDLMYNPLRNSLMAGTDVGFIESYDNGKTWEAFKTLVPPSIKPIRAVGSHPRFKEVFWMGTENQIHRTDDDGITWKFINIPVQKFISMIQTNPMNPKRMYAGLSQ